MARSRFAFQALPWVAIALAVACAAPPPHGPGDGPPAHRQPVLSVSGVTLRMMESNPPQLAVSAVGQAASAGWTDATLEPNAVGLMPADGVYRLTLAARPPSGPAAQMLTPVSANRNLGALPPSFRAVRIAAATNDCTAYFDGRATVCSGDQNAGAGDAPPVPNWVGRRLVRLGQPDPGGIVVRESDIPQPYRIFDPQHQIGDMMFNPNRLDITVDDRDVITEVRRG